ncbi:hypothetical protein J3R30DRAFT_3431869 [Lentinula aciculospora]|uniref:JmjC domain-containing protein n=1 Tax=Lentinula aciculospora TaxID=153920 RepID=A0A9W9AQH3_9AGAR|nr:hypothetical protein J3R30DRAFT_3431869 [Lentinula aciculospora]
MRRTMEEHRADIIREDSRNVPMWANTAEIGRTSCSSCSSSIMECRRVQPSSKSQNQVLSCKGWTLNNLLRDNQNFRAADRVPVGEVTENLITSFDSNGKPFVIEGLQHLPGWRKDLLSVDWLKDESPIKEILVRNIHNDIDKVLPLSEFLERTRHSSPFVQPGETERLYGKDLETPKSWNDWLNKGNVVPQQFLPTVDNLLNYLPESAKVETLMNYIGTGDTLTPSHKDPCASHGHNLMCYTENGGSSFWFMTKQEDARKVADYFHNRLGHDIDHESYVSSVEDFANAPFPVYIIEQKLGDLVIVPRMSCHQVVNHGGLTVKMSWSRMSLKSISEAVYHELPLYRRVCRSETYRVRLTLYHYIRVLYKTFAEQVNRRTHSSERNIDLEEQSLCAGALECALSIFDDVLKNECVEHYASLPCDPSSENFLTCDVCGADIFQSFFECENCSFSGDPITLCPGCYAEGRTCRCRTMQPKQLQPLDNILQERDKVIEVLTIYWKTNHKQGVRFASNAALFSGGAFKAACLLAKVQHKEPKLLTCSKGQSHQLPNSDVLSCKPCHFATCFFHLLEKFKLHAIHVLLDRDKDAGNTHKSHHKRHKNGRKEYDTHLPDYLADERSATKPRNFEIQMVNLALSFPNCRPIKCFSIQGGWYDSSIIIEPAMIRSNTPPDMLIVETPPPPPYVAEAPHDVNLDTLSQVADLPATIDLYNFTTQTTVSQPSELSSRRLRTLMDYVLVPTPTYQVKKDSRTTPRFRKDIEVIDVSSSSESEYDAPQPTLPPKRNIGPPMGASTSSRSSSYTRKPRRDKIPLRPMRPVQLSDFNNELVSAINESGNLTGIERTIKQSSSAKRVTFIQSAPLDKGKRKRTQTPSNGSASLRKRRLIESDSDNDSSGDFISVAEPHIPPPSSKATPGKNLRFRRSVGAFGKNREEHANVAIIPSDGGSSSGTGQKRRQGGPTVDIEPVADENRGARGNSSIGSSSQTTSSARAVYGENENLRKPSNTGNASLPTTRKRERSSNIREPRMVAETPKLTGTSRTSVRVESESPERDGCKEFLPSNTRVSKEVSSLRVENTNLRYQLASLQQQAVHHPTPPDPTPPVQQVQVQQDPYAYYLQSFLVFLPHIIQLSVHGSLQTAINNMSQTAVVNSPSFGGGSSSQPGNGWHDNAPNSYRDPSNISRQQRGGYHNYNNNRPSYDYHHRSGNWHDNAATAYRDPSNHPRGYNNNRSSYKYHHGLTHHNHGRRWNAAPSFSRYPNNSSSRAESSRRAERDVPVRPAIEEERSHVAELSNIDSQKGNDPNADIGNRPESSNDARMSDDEQNWEDNYEKEDDPIVPRKEKQLIDSSKSKSNDMSDEITHNPW